MKWILISIFLISCSTKQAVKEEVSSFRNTNLPFSFEIKEEANDGQSLYLSAVLSAFEEWGNDEVLIQLSGLNNGEIVNEYFYLLSGLLKTQFPQEDLVGKTFLSKNLLFSIPLNNQTDYHIELLWGADAKNIQKNKVISFKDLELVKLNCSDCYADTLKVKLYNNGNDEIDSVKLGFGYVWLNSLSSVDLSAIIPQNEQQITVNSMNLLNSSEYNLEFNLSPPIVNNPGEGKYIPLLRTIEYTIK